MPAIAYVGRHATRFMAGGVLVALSGHAGIEVTAFFALAQLPMHMLPVVLDPLYRKPCTHELGVARRYAVRPG